MLRSSRNTANLSGGEDSLKNAKSLPVLSGGWPLLGHLAEFIKDPVMLLTRAWQEQGELALFRLGTRNVVLFTGPESHDFYFRSSEADLNAKAVYQFTVPIFGRGVAYDAAPEIMDEQLGFLFPALKDASMRRFSRIMFEETIAFADAMGDRGEIDLPHELNELTVKIASRCLIGQEIRDRVDTGFAEAYHELQNGINTLGFFLPHLPTPGHWRRDRARRRIANMFGQVIADRRKTGRQSDDFMQTLMEARYKDGRALNDDEITGILLTVLFAGQHTSAVLATWTGLELMNSPSYLEKVRNELQDVYRNSPTVSLDSLKKQIVLEYAVRENERMHPPLILLVRKVMNPLNYRGYTIPAGTLAMVSPAVAHRMPHLFANPDEFSPNRYALPAREDKRHRYTLIGFGGGKHMCMGKNFAYMQLKAIWSVLLDRFDFYPDGAIPAPNYGTWVTGPKEPARLRFCRRSGNRLLA